jgi:hypothetical protein
MCEGGREPDRSQFLQSSSALPSTYVCRVSARIVPSSVRGSPRAEGEPVFRVRQVACRLDGDAQR